MAASSKTSLFKDYTGKVGNQFVLKRYGDKSVICALPKKDKRKKRTPRQLENNELMARANYTAKSIMKNAERRNNAQLFLNVTSNKLYTSLVRSYFKVAKAYKEKTGNFPSAADLKTIGWLSSQG